MNILTNLLSASQCLLLSENHSQIAMEELCTQAKAECLQTEQGRIETHLSAMGNVYGAYNRDLRCNVYNNIAIIPVHGMLLNRFNSSWGFITGYNYIKNTISAALEDPMIDKIVLDVNSVGGQASGAFETADFIKQASKIKPIYAVVDDLCLSAAYAISSGATKIYATESSIIGSIGVLSVHKSFEQMLKNDGVKVTLLQAGSEKAVGNHYKDLSEKDKAILQSHIEKVYDRFVECVSVNRKISKESVVKTQAACYAADDSKSIGLIDNILSVESAIHKISNSQSVKESVMTKDVTEAQAAAPQAAAPQAAAPQAAAPQAAAPQAAAPQAAAPQAAAPQAAAQAERVRIAAIMQCDSAQANMNLAKHFAFNTSLSADEAIAALQAAAPQTAPQAAAQGDTNLLMEAMAAKGSPQVGQDAENSELRAEAQAVFDFLSKQGE